ncbi:MAG: hypothetical protein PVF82_15660 [Gammaproteobacteria bacterium]
MFSSAFKYLVIGLIGYGIYTNWEHVEKWAAGKYGEYVVEEETQDYGFSENVLSLESFECHFVDGGLLSVTTTGVIKNLTDRRFGMTLIEITLLNESAEDIGTVRMQPSPPFLNSHGQISFTAAQPVGRLSPTHCKLAGILVLVGDKLERAPYEANCSGCETI